MRAWKKVIVSFGTLAALMAGCGPKDDEGAPIPQEVSDTDRGYEEPSVGERSVSVSTEALMTEAYAAGTYNRERARWYIQNYALHPNPGYRYCASTLSGLGADCTNFASQVLAFGGIPMQTGDSQDSGWWYRDSCGGSGSSKSWRQVNELMRYLTITTGRGQIVTDVRQLQVGDLIFYKLRVRNQGYYCDGSTIFNHTAVVSGFDNGKPLVAYHSYEENHKPWDEHSPDRENPYDLGDACMVAKVHIKY